jgi:hypothetical protein
MATDTQESVSLKATLTRRTETRVPNDTIRKHLIWITQKALRKAEGWSCSRSRMGDPVYTDDGWMYRFDLTFKPIEGVDAVSLEEMAVELDFARRNYQRFKDNPYTWDQAPDELEIQVAASNRKKRRSPKKSPDTLLPDNGEDDLDATGVIKDIPILEDLDPSIILLPHQIYVPKELLSGEDADIESNYAFRGIHGRGPHIRRVLQSINAFQNSAQIAYDQRGEEMDLTRNHVLLWGPPATAKTRILRGVRRLLERGSYFTLDAPSATKAGIVRLFRKTFRHRCPPVVFVEEIEKMKEGLEGWLGLLDERAQLQKFTHFEQDIVSVNFLCIATCNDKSHLDTVLKGALGSRFGHQVYVPRPSMDEMRLILTDRVREIRGDSEWVDVCIELMDDFNTDDPREVKSWLDYGRALIDGTAVRDLKMMYERQRRDFGKKRLLTAADYEDDGPSDQQLAMMEAAKLNGNYMSVLDDPNPRRRKHGA